MAKKMPRRLVALSSSAIAAIYLAGFTYTRSADAGLAAATSVPTPATASPSPTASSSQPGVVVSASAPATTTSSSAPATAASPTPTSAPTSTPTATSAYKDGTYTGSGTSRRGDVSVSVTIQSGRIANVTISGVTTQYPVSRIASLPAQVISRQSGLVDNISGATYSAQAFRLAVQVALGKASA